MAFPLKLDTPILKINNDILWKIFSIIADPDPYPEPSSVHPLPLTNIRRCSQVCSFWRKFILESSSIWGSCLDLDLLGQTHDDWRQEVLSRTGNALLSVRDQQHLRPGMPSPSASMQKFVIDIISDHWERIKLLSICITRGAINDIRVRDAFCRPARHLRVFALRENNLGSRPQDEPGFIFLPNSQLFANDAPSLAHFFVGESTMPDSVMLPFPSFLISGQLRYLTLRQPLAVSAVHLLDACAQMPLLEALDINIANLILEEAQDPIRWSSSLRSVSLPRLQSIWLHSSTLDIYQKFLSCLTARPRKRALFNYLQSMPQYSTKMLKIYAEEIQETLLHDISSVFPASHIAGSPSIKFLGLYLCSNHCMAFEVASCQEEGVSEAESRTVFLTDRAIPFAIRDSFNNALFHLELPATLVRFKFIFLIDELWDLPSLSPFFMGLVSITELSTCLEGLIYIIENSETENLTFFPSLKIVFLMDTDSTVNATWVSQLKYFFAIRQGTIPVEVLDFSEWERPFGDLRILDEIVGLKVVWKSRPEGSNLQASVKEYVCGSGDPEQLLRPDDNDN